MPHCRVVSIFCPSTTLRPGQVAAVYDLRRVRLPVSLSQAGTLYSCSPRCCNFLNANTPRAEINPIHKDFFFSLRANSASSELHSYAANLNQASVLPETMSELIAAVGSSFPATPVGFYSPPLTAEQQKTATSVCFFSSLCWSAPGGRRNECVFNKRQLPQGQLFQAMQSCNYS